MLTTMQVLPDNAKRITKGCLVLHNIMQARYPNLQNEELDQGVHGMVVSGSWRDTGELVDCQQEGATGERFTRQGWELRQYLMHDVNSE